MLPHRPTTDLLAKLYPITVMLLRLFGIHVLGIPRRNRRTSPCTPRKMNEAVFAMHTVVDYIEVA
jgi:hypothetical protein